MKRKLHLLCLMMCMCAVGLAQTRQVTGHVTKGTSSEALGGGTVAIKGTNTRTTTNSEGAYTINVPAGNVTLVFSYVGHTTKEVNVAGRTTVDVALQEETSTLNDVVVVGYTPQRRRDLTGAVSSVGARQLKDIPLSSAAEALTGKLAGVQVTTAEGAPGADVVIRVRGGGSITQDNSPIYIVDGIQVENALSVISPQDIASVDVLKDASTTAIYGARGANGVVIITTKSGRPGRTVVTYNGSAGFREIAKTMDVLNPYDFTVWQYERAQLNADTSFYRIYGTTWDTLQNYKNAPFINWQKEVFGRKAAYQNHNVSVSGGDQKTTFNLSLTDNIEQGVQLESAFDRKLAAFRLDHKASDKFRVGINIRYLDQTVKGSGTTNSGTRTTNRLRHTIQYRPFDIPTVPGADEFDENYYQQSAGIINPVLLTQAEYKRAYTKGTNISGYFSYVLAKNLTFKSTAGFDNSDVRQDAFYSKITPTARNFAALPDATINTQNSVTINNSNTLDYTKNGIANHHDIGILVGQEIYETNSTSMGMETRYFPADISPEKALANMSLGSPPSGASQPRPTTAVTPPSRILSLFSQVRYSFDKKILANFTVRADRTTKFKYENGVLVFPSGSVAWRFTQENFMEKTSSWLSDGKIRIGFGTAGNNRIGDLLYQQLYGVTGEYALNHTVLPGYAPSALANENLKWEKTISQNVGLDLSFFNNRIQFTTDVYYNKGNDLLLQVAIPPTSGYSSQLRNVGSTSNRGIEFQVSAFPVQTKNFSWNSNFNISFNRNRVESLGGLTQQTRNSGWQGSDGLDDYLVKVGEPIGLMYGFVNDGWYKIEDFDYNATTATYTLKAGVPNSQIISGTVRPGSLKIRDVNKDGQITADDRTVLGNANPKFTGGWNNQFTYKNFDLSVFVNFVVGDDIYNANKIEWTDGSFPNLNVLGVMRDRWKNIDAQGQLVTDPAALAKLNQNVKIWTPVNSNRFFLNSYDVEDGSFLRFNNVTLGYTLPGSLSKKVKLSQFRVYATVNNLATITNYSGFDPEVTARRTDPLTPGVDFAAYPRARTWVFGVNVSF